MEEKFNGLSDSAFVDPDLKRINDVFLAAEADIRLKCLDMALQTRLPDDNGRPTNSITASEAIEAAQLFYNFITSKN